MATTNNTQNRPVATLGINLHADGSIERFFDGGDIPASQCLRIAEQLGVVAFKLRDHAKKTILGSNFCDSE